MSEEKSDRPVFAAVLAALVGFAVLAKGAHDVWSATVVHVLMLGVFIAFLIRRRDAFAAGALLPLLAALVGIGASFLFSIKPGDTVWALKDCFFAALFFLMIADLGESDEAINVLLLIICGVIVVETGLMVHARFKTAGPIEEAGTLVNANVAAFFFLPWVPVLVERFRQGWKKPLCALALVCAVAGIALAASYSALALLLLSLPFFSRGKFKWKSFATTSLTVAVFLMGLFALREYQLSHLPLYRASNRLDWWKAGLGMFLDHPLTGVGLGNYQSAFLVYKTGLSQNTLFAHNIIVTLLSETGLLGVGGAVVFLTAWAAGLSKSHRLDSRSPFILGFALLFLYSLYNIGPEYFVGKLLLAAFAGLAAGRMNQISIRNSVLVVLVAAAVGSLPFLVTPFLASQDLVYANTELAAGHLEEAKAAYRSAVQLNPLLSEAHAGLAKAAFLEGRLGDAFVHQQDALRLDKMNRMLLRDMSNYQEDPTVNAS